MKKSNLILTIYLLSNISIVSAQSMQQAMGGGPANIPTDEITSDQRGAIFEMINNNIDLLKQEGKITSSTFNKTATVLLEFPLAWNTGFNDYGFYGISNFVDHDAAYPGSVLDYNCGNRTYDTDAGYNHQGIDYFLWPFSWNLMHEGAVKIVAAAPGMIVGKSDGYADESCAMSGLPWNSVYIRHADGSTAWYGHMANGSLTTKVLGDMVGTGEYLGRVGSSGNSTGPHLHFELYDAGNVLMDPNEGECNMWNADSWWADQPPYIAPKINKIQTHFAPPVLNPCPTDDIINARDTFQRGDLVYFAIYAKDLTDTTLCHFIISEPDGTPWNTWDFYQPVYYSASYWYWFYYLPMNAAYGEWNFSCTIHGVTASHPFMVQDPAAPVTNIAAGHVQVFYYEGNLHLHTEYPMPTDQLLQICNTAGQKIWTDQMTVTSGTQDRTIPIVNLPDGIYFFTITDTGSGAAQTLRFNCSR